MSDMAEALSQICESDNQVALALLKKGTKAMARFGKKNFIIVDAECASDLINKIERTILNRNLDLLLSVYDIKGTSKKKIVVSR